ncbi:MAG: MerR family transcriptional regulator [Thermodesulfobacteriota bacterium]
MTQKQIPEKLYFKIGEVADLTKVKPYVLRYWENEFKIISPKKSSTRQRVYSKRDVELILEIKKLLYKEKFTLEGAKKRIKEIRAEKAKQLDFPFSETRYRSTIDSIKKELNSIRKILA